MSREDRSSSNNVLVRVALAFVAMFVSMVFVGGFVVALFVAIGLGWWLGASAPDASVAEVSLGGVLVAEVHEPSEIVWREPVRREVRIGRPAPVATAPEVSTHAATPAPVEIAARPVAAPVAAPVAPPPAAPVAPPVVDERPAVAEVPAEVPSLEEQMRALRARMATGELETVEGEAGRVSVGG